MLKKFLNRRPFHLLACRRRFLISVRLRLHSRFGSGTIWVLAESRANRTAGRCGATIILPGETEAGTAVTQPSRGISRWAHRDDERGREDSFSRRPTSIGSKDPQALKIPARRAEYSLTENVTSPFQAEPRQIKVYDARRVICGPGCLGIICRHGINLVRVGARRGLRSRAAWRVLKVAKVHRDALRVARGLLVAGVVGNRSPTFAPRSTLTPSWARMSLVFSVLEGNNSCRRSRMVVSRAFAQFVSRYVAISSVSSHQHTGSYRIPHSTIKLFARNDPMTTSTRWPGLTAWVGFEKAIQ